MPSNATMDHGMTASWETSLWSGARLKFTRSHGEAVIIELLEPLRPSDWKLGSLLTGSTTLDAERIGALRTLLGD
jgi:hypothetical protein